MRPFYVNPHAPVAQKVADEVVSQRFKVKESNFFNRTSLTPLRFLMRIFCAMGAWGRNQSGAWGLSQKSWTINTDQSGQKKWYGNFPRFTDDKICEGAGYSEAPIECPRSTLTPGCVPPRARQRAGFFRLRIWKSGFRAGFRVAGHK